MSIVKCEPIRVNNQDVIYQGYNFDIGKTRWSVVVTEQFGNPINVRVRKVYPNPFGTLGTEFDSFNEVVKKYKNPTMKMNLRLIEMGI